MTEKLMTKVVYYREGANTAPHSESNFPFSIRLLHQKQVHILLFNKLLATVDFINYYIHCSYSLIIF